MSAWHIPPSGGAWGGMRLGLGAGLLFFLFLLLPACRRTRPQLPSNKPLPVEVPALDAARMNREMAQREDSLITVYVAHHCPDMEKTGDGYWMRLERVTDGRRLALHDTCRVRCRLSALDGRVLEEMPPRTVVVGKKDIVPGLDAGLQQLRPGEGVLHHPEGVDLMPANIELSGLELKSPPKIMGKSFLEESSSIITGNCLSLSA